MKKKPSKAQKAKLNRETLLSLVDCRVTAMVPSKRHMPFQDIMNGVPPPTVAKAGILRLVENGAFEVQKTNGEVICRLNPDGLHLLDIHIPEKGKPVITED